MRLVALDLDRLIPLCPFIGAALVGAAALVLDGSRQQHACPFIGAALVGAAAALATSCQTCTCEAASERKRKRGLARARLRPRRASKPSKTPGKTASASVPRPPMHHLRTRGGGAHQKPPRTDSPARRAAINQLANAAQDPGHPTAKRGAATNANRMNAECQTHRRGRHVLGDVTACSTSTAVYQGTGLRASPTRHPARRLIRSPPSQTPARANSGPAPWPTPARSARCRPGQR